MPVTLLFLLYAFNKFRGVPGTFYYAESRLLDGGKKISVSTLDLNRPFKEIALQNYDIAKGWM